MRDFIATESAGGVLLAGGALVALIWANSPWSGAYDSLWATRLSVSIGGHGLDLDLRHWINDGLMTVFFLVVGLEIKRELVDGHLSSKRAAMLPMFAAVGGMLIPAVVYLSIAGGTAARGWAIPMATDIALAVGVLTLAGSRVPASLRAFLLGLAIVDDIGAIIIIAAVYSSGLEWAWLMIAGGTIALAVVLRFLQIRTMGVYVLIGTGTWIACYEAGIHPTLAGVALGLLAPSIPRQSAGYVDVAEFADQTFGDSGDSGHSGDVSAAAAARDLATSARESVSVVEWLQHVLHPWSGYVIVPTFALANSGIKLGSESLGDAFTSPVAWGVFAGLVVGKPLGVMAASKAALRAGVSEPPAGAAGMQMFGVSSAAGIGFTVALFIAELAFTDPARQAEAKVAILAASLIAAALATALLRTARPTPVRPLLGTSAVGPIES